MKLYIKKGQYGWYTSATNYKDKEDKQYVNLFFPKGTEPADEVEYIDPTEWKLTSYKGKVGMTIFKYNTEAFAYEHDSTPVEQSDVVIPSDALPFY